MVRELLVAINVVDENGYEAYRSAIQPILERNGGGFRADFDVAGVRSVPGDVPINRVFTIHFADANAQAAFFADPDYAVAKNEHLEGTIDQQIILAAYD